MSEQTKSLIEIAKLAATLHDERRRYKWKVSFALWGLIVAGIAKKSFPHLSFVSLPLAIVGLVIYAMFWLRCVWVANENEERESPHYITEALNTLKDPNYKPSDPTIPSFITKSGDFGLAFYLTGQCCST